MTAQRPGEWGTAVDPLIMSPYGWEHLHPFLAERMAHVHLYHGAPDQFSCALNKFGDLCYAGHRINADDLR